MRRYWKKKGEEEPNRHPKQYQEDIMRMVKEGERPDIIAARLGFAPNTIKYWVKRWTNVEDLSDIRKRLNSVYMAVTKNY